MHQELGFQIFDLQVLNAGDLNQPTSNLRIEKSQEGATPRDDVDPRFQFRDGLLYYDGLLYVPEDPCRLRVL